MTTVNSVWSAGSRLNESLQSLASDEELSKRNAEQQQEIDALRRQLQIVQGQSRAASLNEQQLSDDLLNAREQLQQNMTMLSEKTADLEQVRAASIVASTHFADIACFVRLLVAPTSFRGK